MVILQGKTAKIGVGKYSKIIHENHQNSRKNMKFVTFSTTLIDFDKNTRLQQQYFSLKHEENVLTNKNSSKPSTFQLDLVENPM